MFDFRFSRKTTSRTNRIPSFPEQKYEVYSNSNICKKVPYIIVTVKSTGSTVCKENLNESITILFSKDVHYYWLKVMLSK